MTQPSLSTRLFPLLMIFLALFALTLQGCFHSSSGGGSGPAAPVDRWTWMSGSDVVNQSGSYGTKGNVDVTNVPGARELPVSWVDVSGNFWLFGGRGYDSVGIVNRLNDLWRWDGNNWTWISGSDVVNQSGTYGTKGTADEANMPGARNRLVSWTDTAGNLWLFGGEGYDSTGGFDTLNDMWRYQP